MASFIRNKDAIQPFVHKMQEGSYQSYKLVWKRLLCFVYRLVHQQQGPSPNLHHCMTSEQLAMLEQLVQAAKAVVEDQDQRSQQSHYQERQSRRQNHPAR